MWISLQFQIFQKQLLDDTRLDNLRDKFDFLMIHLQDFDFYGTNSIRSDFKAKEVLAFCGTLKKLSILFGLNLVDGAIGSDLP